MFGSILRVLAEVLDIAERATLVVIEHLSSLRSDTVYTRKLPQNVILLFLEEGFYGVFNGRHAKRRFETSLASEI